MTDKQIAALVKLRDYNISDAIDAVLILSEESRSNQLAIDIALQRLRDARIVLENLTDIA